MSAESIKENAIRKVIQELVVPDLQKLIGKIDILEERISSTNTRIDALKNELKSDIARLDERINSLYEKIDSLDDKMDTKITALSEKVDYMNKTNERLFDIIIHSSDTKKIAG